MDFTSPASQSDRSAVLTEGRRAPHILARRSCVSGSSSHTPSGLTLPHRSASRANSSKSRSSTSGALAQTRDLASSQWLVCVALPTSVRVIAGMPPARRLKSPSSKATRVRVKARQLAPSVSVISGISHGRIRSSDPISQLTSGPAGVEADGDQAVEDQQPDRVGWILDDRRGIEPAAGMSTSAGHEPPSEVAAHCWAPLPRPRFELHHLTRRPASTSGQLPRSRVDRPAGSEGGSLDRGVGRCRAAARAGLDLRERLALNALLPTWRAGHVGIVADRRPGAYRPCGGSGRTVASSRRSSDRMMVLPAQRVNTDACLQRRFE